MPEETVATEQVAETTGEFKTVYDQGLSLSEFKKIADGEKIPKEPAAAEPKKETSEAEPAETAGTTEVPEQETQEQKKVKRDRSEKGRIDELTAFRRKAETERDEWRRKFEESEKRATQPAKPSEPAKTDQPKDDDPKPKPKDYLDKHETYEDGLEAYQDARIAWEKRQDQKQQAKRDGERQQAENAKRINERIKDIREKHENWDETGAKLALSPVMRDFAVEDDQGLDVIQFLAENAEEYERITQISNPVKLVAAMGRIARSLEPPPERKQPKPVSAAPAPPRTVTGTEAAPSKSPYEAKTMAEFRKLEEARLSRRGT